MKELWEYQKELDFLTKEKINELDDRLIPAKQAYFWYERNKSVKLAQIINQISGSLSAPMSKLEMLALSSEEYKEFNEGYCKAHDVFFSANIKRETIINRVETLRTLISLEKEKMRLT